MSEKSGDESTSGTVYRLEIVLKRTSGPMVCFVDGDGLEQFEDGMIKAYQSGVFPAFIGFPIVAAAGLECGRQSVAPADVAGWRWIRNGLHVLSVEDGRIYERDLDVTAVRPAHSWFDDPPDWGRPVYPSDSEFNTPAK